jgi:phage terminase large subunit
MWMEAKFKTFEKQRVALRKLRDNSTNEVLYGGGARGGKSWLGTGWVHMECISKPGSAWLIAREELTKLKDTTLITFFKTAKELGVKNEFHYNAQNYTATFNNGSIVFFRELKYVPSDPEFDRLGSYDLTGAFIDEAQQIHSKAISVLKGRFSVLSGEGWSTIPKVLYTCNPAKNWIYSDFVKPSIDNTLKKGRAFIKSLATDNPFVGQDYIDFLQGADKVTKERLLYGNFEYDDDPSALIPINKIYDCFTNNFVEDGEMYISGDIARFGRDRTVIGVWSGFKLLHILTLNKNKVTEAADLIKKLCNTHRVPISNVVIDDDGVGGGVTDILNGCHGFVNNSKAIENPESNELENFNNLKSQCYFKLADKINKSELSICETEFRDEIVEELEQVKQYNMDKDAKKQILPKDKVKELIGRSPDFSDMIMMRMFFEVGVRFVFSIK